MTFFEFAGQRHGGPQIHGWPDWIAALVHDGTAKSARSRHRIAIGFMDTRMSQQRRTADKPIRSRDPVATRADLLKAARKLFCQKSYEFVGARQIAAEAGVTKGMVHWYFGSKKELFAAAIDGLLAPDLWFEGDRATSGLRMATWVTSERLPDGSVNPLVLAIQSSGHPEVKDIVIEAFETQGVIPLAAWLGGPRAPERARELISIITGNYVLYKILRDRVLPKPELKIVINSLSRILQEIVDGSAERKASQDHSNKSTRGAST